MKIKTETQTGSIVSFDYDNEIAEITGLTTSFEPKQDGTPWMSDLEQTPYLNRRSPDFDHDYNSEMDTLIGGSIAWNQIASFAADKIPSDRNGIDFSYTDGTSFKMHGTSTGLAAFRWFDLSEISSLKYRENHKCAILSKLVSGSITNGNCSIFLATQPGIVIGNASIQIVTKDSDNLMGLQIAAPAGVVFNNAVITFIVVDLTATFGTEIADYVYSLEQSTAGSGIAWLKSYGFLTKDYYAHDTGSLVSVKTSEHRTVGFNQWDEEWEEGSINGATGQNEVLSTIRSKNYIPAVGGSVYYFAVKTSGKAIFVFAYDADKNYIGTSYVGDTWEKTTAPTNRANGTATLPQNAKYIRFRMAGGYGTTYLNDVCVNISKATGTPKNGDYVAYESHSYPLDSDLELRGIPKLSNGNLYYDGDEYRSDGNVTRKYGIVDLGSLTWNSQTAYGFTSYYCDYYKNNGNLKPPSSNANKANVICSRFATTSWNDFYQNGTIGIAVLADKQIRIHDTQTYADGNAFKTAMSGVYLVYELATPTTETADGFTSPQIVSPYGTEEYVDTRDVPVPVGHRTTYMLPYPISGWDEVKAYVSPTEEEEDATIYTINLNGTRYGGDIDFFSGKMLVTHGFYTVTGNESVNWAFSNRSGVQIAYANLSSIMTGVKTTGGVQQTALFDKFKTSRSAGGAGVGDAYVDNGYVNLGFSPNMFATSNDVKAWLRSGNIEVVYELATPLEVQLAAEQIEALQGQNNVWANCGDITLSWLYAPVLSEAVKLNGKYIELIVDGYTTLGTSGRRSLERDLTTYSVGTADGETVKDSVFPSRVITVYYVIQTDTEEELTDAINQLANILNQDECDFVFRDESDKYFSGYALLDSEPKKYRNAIKGSWSIYCAYPFKRSIDLIELSSKDASVASSEAHSATFVFDYNGTLPAHPILRAEFASAKSGGEYNEDGDCGYVAFLDAEENIIQLGNPEVLDVDQYANSKLINREFTSLSGWTASGVTVGDLTDQFWENGKGQTQSYAKGTGTLTKSVGNGAINMEFDIVHRLCVSAANQTGAFECYAKNGNTIVVGFKIEKTGSGTTGVVSYIINNKVVGTDSIDLSYYNTHFGYCNRTAVYGTEYYSVYEKYYVKKKGKKKKKYHWVTYPRTVQTGWSYTQSNLNSGWSKDGSVIVFSIGNLADRTFKNSDVELTPSTSVVFNISGSFHTNAVHSCAMLSKAGVPFAEIPNVFTAGDVVEGDCNSADVMLYRKGSLEGHLEPQYGALGNDWEDFEIKPGKNIIRAVWSDWVNTSYKPEIKIIFNEVYV